MSHKDKNNSIFEDVETSNQSIKLVKNVKIDDKSNDTYEVDVLADFQSKEEAINIEKKPKKMKVIEVGQEDNIPFEATRELKVKRNSSYDNNEEYKEKVIVNPSEDKVGVKKIIIGEETNTLPIYKKPKKDFKKTLRDIIIYLLMIAIVSICVILLMKYCQKSKNDNRHLPNLSTTSKTTTKLTSEIPHTETTTTLTTTSVATVSTTQLTSQKPGLEIPTTPKPVTPSTPKPVETEQKPESTKPTTPTESTTESTTKPLEPTPSTTEPSENDINEQE